MLISDIAVSYLNLSVFLFVCSKVKGQRNSYRTYASDQRSKTVIG